jgi:hypothetical protein
MIAVVFPTWVMPSGSVGTDLPAAILVVLMSWTLIEGKSRQSRLWLMSGGIVLGIAILVRPVSVAYTLAVIVWLLIVTDGWKNRLSAIGGTILAATVIVAPWSLRNWYVQGRFVLVSTQGGSELYKSNNPDATGVLANDQAHFLNTLMHRYPKSHYLNEATRSDLFQKDALKFILENPVRFVELSFVRFIQLWKVYSPRVPLLNSIVVMVTFGVALPFFLIQITRRGWRRGPEMLLLLIIVFHTAVHVVFTSAVRYRIPIEPLVIVLAIEGLAGLQVFRMSCWPGDRNRASLGCYH